ncbi:MAG TPA: LysR family transcriptional regulator [Candidatus Avamphibacillus intestinigallinarum]|nr:LysR family transcriptional regulator [Candidatus Avamphibacillus intestinigallinarum]
MSIKLDSYKIFGIVAEHKSFSEAAKVLFMTQPAISQAVSQLERELDTRLFKRTPHGVTLTDEGRLLYEYVHSAIGLIDVAEEKILEFKNLTAGELKIGVGDTISRYFLLPALEKFHNTYPNVKFRIVNGTTFELCNTLKTGDVDIAICNFPIDDSDLELRPCIDVQDIFVCGEKFKNLLKKPAQLDELVKLPLIFLESQANSRQYVENYLLSKGIQITPEFELGSHDLMLEFARINLGIACVTEEFSLDLLDKGLIYPIPLEEPIPKRSIGVCYLKNVPLSPSATRFVDIIESM